MWMILHNMRIALQLVDNLSLRMVGGSATLWLLCYWRVGFRRRWRFMIPVKRVPNAGQHCGCKVRRACFAPRHLHLPYWFVLGSVNYAFIYRAPTQSSSHFPKVSLFSTSFMSPSHTVSPVCTPCVIFGWLYYLFFCLHHLEHAQSIFFRQIPHSAFGALVAMSIVFFSRMTWCVCITGDGVSDVILNGLGKISWPHMMTASNGNIFRITGPLYGNHQPWYWL